MKRWIALGVAAAGVVVLACAELSGPLRPTGYGFTGFIRDSVTDSVIVNGILYPKDTVTADTVWFYWPHASLPVRIWADTALGLRARVARGVGLWKQILEYGEYDAILVDDSTTADVIVLSGASNIILAPRPVVYRSMASQCFGETDISISRPDHKQVLLPIHIFIDNKYPVSDDSTQSCLDLTTAHEIGHSLGLFQHSPNPSDLMYSNPLVAQPSTVDASTVLFLYHFRPDLVPSSLKPAAYPFTLTLVDTADVDTTIDNVHYPLDTVVTSTVWFHWSPSDLPVRVWVDSTGGLNLQQHVDTALALWRQTLRYGQYEATVASDSSAADVLLLAGAPPAPAAHLIRLQATGTQCSSTLDIQVSRPDHRRLVLPMRAYIENTAPAIDPATQACLHRIVAHVIGHTIGLFQHSSNPADLMYASPRAVAPTSADSATALWLYHLGAGLSPSPRP